MSSNLHYHPQRVGKDIKNKKFGHKSPVIWLTGLSGSGKSTIANRLEEILFEKGIKTQVLDGDNVRIGLNKDLGFSDKDRVENMRRIAETAKLFSDSGTLTITAFISPFENERQNCYDLIGFDNVIEVFVNTTLKTCEERDPKGLYKKARKGEIKNFTGIDSTYDKPIISNGLEIITDNETIDESVNRIVDYLEINNWIKSTKEISNLDKKKTISVDFDGVIHKYSKGFQGLENIYDGLMEGCVESLKELHDKGFKLKILSSRPKEVIEPWLVKNNIDYLFDGVSNHKFPATIYIDDRGYHFKDWETTLKEIMNHPKIQK